MDQSIQLGDGGVGIILQTQVFNRLTGHLFGYLSVSYLVSPKKKSQVQFVKADGTGSGIYLSVPDGYSGRLGAAYAIWPAHGLVGSLGGRVDGIPLRDAIGGGDDGLRRPGYAIYADRGVSFAVAKGAIALSTPVRIGQSFGPDLTPGHVDVAAPPA